MLENAEILQKLPYDEPFLFVDEIESINEQGVTGYYTFRSDSYFFEGHFKGNPVTPGVILTECCAQIGVVCFGIYLLGIADSKNMQLALTNTEMEFMKPVYPDQKVKVVGEKKYFRFNKLKCKVKMYDVDNELVCSGVIAGMLINSNNEK